MAFFNRNVTFASVDLTVLFDHKIAFAGWLMEQVFELILHGAISAVQPITVMPLSEIESDFRRIQAGNTWQDSSQGRDPLNGEVKVRPQVVTPANFREDASYLIVGGQGGLGREICRWMTSLGARNIIILSRSGPKSESSQALAAELNEKGVKLVGRSCDVSDKQELERALKLCAVEMPPIRGVIQSAMVLRDRTLENMDFDDYKQVIRPKVDGTLNIHHSIIEKCLDFFLMFSSLAGIIGNHSQGNYAAASTFQDAFARYRTGQGLIARSLDIGMIEGAGYITENPEAVRFLLSQGYTSVKLEELLALINYAITTPVADAGSSQLIVGLERPNTTETPEFFLDAKFSHLRVAEKLGRLA